MAGALAPPSDNLFVADLPANFTEEQLKGVLGAYGNITSVRMMPGTSSTSALVRLASQAEATWIKENLNGNIAQGLSTPIKVNFANAPGSGKGKKGGGKGDDGKGWGKGKGGGPYGGDWGAGYGGGGLQAGMAMSYDMAGMWGGGFGKGGKGGGKDKGKGKGKKGGTIRSLKESLVTAGALPGGKLAHDNGNALFVGGLPPDTTTEDLYEIFSPFGAISASGARAMQGEWGECKGFGFVNFLDPMVSQTAIMNLNGAMLPDGSQLKVSIKTPPKGKGQ